MAKDSKTTSSSMEWRMTMPDNSSTRAEQCVEWQVTVPEGSTVKVEHETGVVARAWAWLVRFLVMMKDKSVGFFKNVWKLGVDDPRKVIHGFKVGLALALVTLFYYTRPLYEGVGGTTMWAVMTVVVVFEYTVGKLFYIYRGLIYIVGPKHALFINLLTINVTFKNESDHHSHDKKLTTKRCSHCRRLLVQRIQPSDCDCHSWVHCLGCALDSSPIRETV